MSTNTGLMPFQSRECEVATKEDVEKASVTGKDKTIDDVRRDVRVGMGPCQGGFCTLRVAGMWHSLKKTPVEETNVTLRDFLQERWKGLMPVLWGSQLKQERLDELIYQRVLHPAPLHGKKASHVGPEMYERGTEMERTKA